MAIQSTLLECPTEGSSEYNCSRTPSTWHEAIGYPTDMEAYIIIDSDEEFPPSTPLEIPDTYWVGQDLEWDSPWQNVELWVELPFWLMITDCTLFAEVKGHKFEIIIAQRYYEVHWNALTASRQSAFYMGTFPPRFHYQDQKRINEEHTPTSWRKCRTMLRIKTRCPSGIVSAHYRDRRMARVCQRYFLSLVSAHFEVANKVISRYRLATYDMFAYEISYWDAPLWYLHHGHSLIPVSVMPYQTLDDRPIHRHRDGTREETNYIDPNRMQALMDFSPSPGETELLDGMNLVHRGDYAGALRRLVTSIEVILEARIREEYAKILADEAVVNTEVDKTRNNFERRFFDYLRLTGRRMPYMFRFAPPHRMIVRLKEDLLKVRDLRHRIVHQGEESTGDLEALAFRSLDVLRWVYNWFENKPERAETREKKLVLRMMFGLSRLYKFDITPDGAVVHKPIIPEGPGKEIVGGLLEGLLQSVSFDLVNNLLNVLSLIGFTRLICVDRQHEAEEIEDLQIHDKPTKLLVLVESRDGISLKENLMKVNSYVSHRCQQNKLLSVRGLIVANYQVMVPPSERDHDHIFPDDIVHQAKNYNVGILSTWDLSLLIRGALRWGWSREALRDMLYEVGRIGQHPSHWVLIGKIVH
jgi:hypothetical protein